MDESKTYICLQPEYVGRFRCDGSFCEGRCCKVWTVDIDGNTYQRYSNLPDKKLRQKIVRHIKYLPEKKAFKIKMKDNGDCPFLGSDHLCFIQKNLGEAALSLACTFYPRITHELDGMLERAMYMTCPLALYHVLEDENPLAFEEVPVTFDRQGAINFNHTEALSAVPGLLENFITIQAGCVSLLQNRRYRLDTRMMMMGFFLSQIDDALVAGEPEKIANLAAAYEEADFQEQLVESMAKDMRFRPGEYIKNMFGVIEMLYGQKSAFRQKFRDAADTMSLYLKAVTSVFGLSGKDRQVPLADLVEVYLAQYHRHGQKWVEDHARYFENYFVNEIFLCCYPQRIAGTLTQNYMLFVTVYKTLEFFILSTVSIAKGNLDKSQLIRLFLTYATNTTHNTELIAHLSGKALKTQEIVPFMEGMLRI